MNISTKYFGDVTVDETKSITFPYGLPAFETEHTFFLLPMASDESTPFQILQSATTKDLAFVVCEIFQFFPDFEAELSPYEIESLRLNEAKDATLLGIITVQDPFQSSTINLAAPIVMNVKERFAKQVIVEERVARRRALLFQREEAYARTDT
ncbi:flagellar assembly protein FliW [Geomicrobium sediminis]|uniref:Flagellar assembly factor FliW n=1 Tax=Geomicrobium sediminis TaxID=1347788 RepID=A0ABS2P787_9BACL|nr:flagellar assembly protein FliW [Geomicrobium sediminis]MBM7631278.1 flagellar assembly factor FliW [Geomicrobium sediminis]